MKSILLGLSLVSAAAAQIVNGVSSVPVPAASAPASGAASPGPSSGAASSVPAATPVPPVAAATPVGAPPSAPAVVTPAPVPGPQYGGAPPPPSQYTAPPAPGQDFYQYMPYDSWNGGGYKQLQCGYGYQKQGDSGLCVPYEWVSD